MMFASRCGPVSLRPGLPVHASPLLTRRPPLSPFPSSWSKFVARPTVQLTGIRTFLWKFSCTTMPLSPLALYLWLTSLTLNASLEIAWDAPVVRSLREHT